MGCCDRQAVSELNPLELPLPALYVIFFLAGLVETAVPPFPGDALTVVTSFALARRDGSLAAGLALSCAGSYLGGLTLWVFGAHWSTRVPRAVSRRVNTGALVQAQQLLARRGVPIVVLSRFIPGIRSLILVAAGLGRMPLRQVVWALGLAVALWQSIVVVGGYLAGRYWLRVVRIWSAAGVILMVIVLLAGLLWWRRGTSSGGTDDNG